jgi:hypothetical protein
MDWVQFFGFILTIGGLFFWARTESNADRRQMTDILKEMKDEMKDFHARLLVLEDRYLRIKEKEGKEK